MATAKGVFLFSSIIEAMRDLPEENQGPFIIGIIDFLTTGQEPEFDGIMHALWTLTKPSLEISQKRSEAGRQGGAPTGNENAKNKQNSSKKQPKNKQNSSKRQAIKDLDKGLGIKKETIVSKEMIAAYCAAKGYALDAEALLGKMSGKKITDYRAYIDKIAEDAPKLPPPTKGDFDYRGHFYENMG